MPEQKPIHVLFLAGEDENFLKPLQEYLKKCKSFQVEFLSSSHLPEELNAYAAVLLANPAHLSSEEHERLSVFVAQGGGCLAFIGPHAGPLPSLYPLEAGPAGPSMELRLHFCDPAHPIATRLPPEFFLTDRCQPLHAISEKPQPMVKTRWQSQDVALMLSWNEGRGRICCTTLRALEDPFFRQLVYRLIRHVAGLSEPRSLGVAVLGYGPSGSVGYLHGLALQEVPGFRLLAFCDFSPNRLLQCREDFPDCRPYPTAKELGQDAEVDLVFIATPPNSHAELAIELLRKGKHVVCEKPLCLTRKEAEAMVQAAEENDRVLSCYQNRRWDGDFLAIRRALEEGTVGDPFYLETFCGDYRHPCHYWHSHLPVSGDVLFDWGAHYVDWILNIFPAPTARVMGALHKKVWHDVTNADQMRVQILFADGAEAEFLYSDVAALRKPKWYLLGTKGAILGEWQTIPVRQIDPVTYYREEQIPETETPPLLMLRRKTLKGSMVIYQLPMHSSPRFSYHRNLADHLLTGEPLAVTAQSAARVVAVLEAATRSAHRGGIPEEIRV
jgi:predicted dehydrogenase